MTIPVSKRVRPVKDVLVQGVGDESVVLNLNTERYLGFDSVGRRFWEVLTESDSIQQATDRLLEEYDVESERLEHDIQDFIGKLLEQGLAEVIEEGA